jgi:hypothetical protein
MIGDIKKQASGIFAIDAELLPPIPEEPRRDRTQTEKKIPRQQTCRTR